MGLGFPGHMSIILACAFNLVAGIAFLMVARGNQAMRNLAHKSYHLFVLATTVAVAYLYYLFFTDNYAFKYVYDYSDRALPFFYKLSAFWGGQEGTYLLWLFFNSLFGYIIIKRGGQYKNWGMFFFSVVNFFFLFLLLKLSPFAPLGGWVADGAGLNPLLQDPWMVIHPPVVFLGYSMAAIPFVIAMAALVINDYSAWIKRAFPWVAVTGLMLAAGNILGGYWAYKTLGWGGFWAWDPVENSSFIPWFISLALIHGMVIEKRSGAMRKSNILLAAFVFILVIYGTFLTRSGVLSDFSVHSFVDLGINNYLIGFLVLYTIMTLALFIPRIKSMGNAPLNYNIFSKDFSLFAGLATLFLFSIVVLFWTSLPILTTIFSAEPRAAGLETYNSFALPFGIIFSIFLTASPFVTYHGFQIENWKNKLMIVAAIAIVLSFGLFYFILDTTIVFSFVLAMLLVGISMYVMKPDLRKEMLPALVAFILTLAISWMVGVRNYMYLLFFASASMVIVSNLSAIIKHLPKQYKIAGGLMTHFGFGIMLLGILGSSAFSTNESMVLAKGEAGDAFGRSVSYTGMEGKIEDEHNKLLVKIVEDGQEIIARPELYVSEQGLMRKPYINKKIGYDLYFSPVELQEKSDFTDGILMRKGDHFDLGAYHIDFSGFEIGDPTGPEGSLKITANVTIKSGYETYEVGPSREMIESGENPTWQETPALFGKNNEHTVVLSQIIADQGGAVLKFPTITNAMTEDQLIMDVSKKPLINLVWVGTTVLMIGAGVVFIRRREESIS